MKKTPFLLLALLAFSATQAEAKDVKIKLGTLAPEGSPWHNSIKRLGARIKEISGGTVNVTVYPGGVAGDEGDMVRKMRIGQLHAATITNIGLSRISKASFALQIPMSIQSYEELDYVRDRIGPKIAEEMEKEGFVILAWGDAGWVHFFSSKAASTPADLRTMKMFIWSGDEDSDKAWKSVGFKTVPLSATDVLPSLTTGMIDWFGTSPLFALTSQWYTRAPHMLALNWTPLNGATVITKKQWEEIDPAMREKIKAVAVEEGKTLNLEVRKMGDDAVKQMIGRGLKVTQVTDTSEWQKLAESAYPMIRGKSVPTPLFDQAIALSKEYRAQKK
jgi:TRAP-type C4-dicarboxylate transport system substrate-binding protein